MFSFLKSFFKKDTLESEYLPKEQGRDLPQTIISVNALIEIDPIYQRPLSSDLLPGDVILINWLENKSSTREYPNYYESTYGINAFERAQKLIREGYVRIATPKESLSSLRGVDLAKILEHYGLKKTGKKRELIDRLGESLTIQEIEKHIKERSYIITEKGKSVLDKYYYILFAHRHRAKLYSVSEAILFMDGKKERLSNLGIGSSILKSRLRVVLGRGDYGLARNCFLSLAMINEMHKQNNLAVSYYLYMYIFDVSGWANGANYHENYIMEESATIAPRLIGDKINMNNLNLYFDDAWKEIESIFPQHYLGKEKAYECLVAGFNKDTETIRRLLNLDNRKKRDFSSYNF